MGIPRPKIKNTGSAPKIHLGYLTLITPRQLGLSCPCWKFSTKNFQANNLKSAVKILIYYRIYCRVFIITVLTGNCQDKNRYFDEFSSFDIWSSFNELCCCINSTHSLVKVFGYPGVQYFFLFVETSHFCLHYILRMLLRMYKNHQTFIKFLWNFYCFLYFSWNELRLEKSNWTGNF